MRHIDCIPLAALLWVLIIGTVSGEIRTPGGEIWTPGREMSTRDSVQFEHLTERFYTYHTIQRTR